MIQTTTQPTETSTSTSPTTEVASTAITIAVPMTLETTAATTLKPPTIPPIPPIPVPTDCLFPGADLTASQCQRLNAAAVVVAVAAIVAKSVVLLLTQVAGGVALQNPVGAFELLAAAGINVRLLMAANFPANILRWPNVGTDLDVDVCGYSSVLYSDGNCYSLLRRGPCPPLQWITVNPRDFLVSDFTFKLSSNHTIDSLLNDEKRMKFFRQVVRSACYQVTC